jgi:hypothetical protein
MRRAGAAASAARYASRRARARAARLPESTAGVAVETVTFVAFYERLGYAVEERVSMGRRLGSIRERVSRVSARARGHGRPDVIAVVGLVMVAGRGGRGPTVVDYGREVYVRGRSRRGGRLRDFCYSTVPLAVRERSSSASSGPGF